MRIPKIKLEDNILKIDRDVYKLDAVKIERFNRLPDNVSQVKITITAVEEMEG